MADPTAGVAIGGVAGAALGGPAGAVAGAALGAALAQGSTPGKRGTVNSPRVAAAKSGKASKGRKGQRPGALPAIGREIRDRIHARGERRLDERRPGSVDTVRFTWRAPKDGTERRVGFIRPARESDPAPVSDRSDIKSAPIAPTGETETRRERGGDQPFPAPGVTTSPVAAAAGVPIAAAAAERSNVIMPVSRYTISLEPPTSDGEFLEQARAVSQALTGLAEQVEAWADALSALKMPAPILDAFRSIPEGLNDAAGQSVSGAQQFEEYFEEARNIAQGGMRIEGTDAA
jgi:hypothetical protein